MKSTGEVMGIDPSFGMAFAKSQMAAGLQAARLRAGSSSASMIITRSRIVPVAEAFARMGFQIAATRGTADRLAEARGRGRDDPQGERGAPPRGGSHQERRDPARHQREPGPALLAETPTISGGGRSSTTSSTRRRSPAPGRSRRRSTPCGRNPGRWRRCRSTTETRSGNARRQRP